MDLDEQLFDSALNLIHIQTHTQVVSNPSYVTLRYAQMGLNACLKVHSYNVHVSVHMYIYTVMANLTLNSHLCADGPGRTTTKGLEL
jgi:hypothetical protein